MQPGFFDLESRHQQLVDWRDFRPVLDRIREKERKSAAGRKPYDVVLMFKILFLKSFYGLGDDQTEYQIQTEARPDQHGYNMKRWSYLEEAVA